MIFLFAFFSTRFSIAFDPDLPHGHNGKLRPMTDVPALVSLSKEQKSQLEEGVPVFMRVRKEGSGGVGVAVQYIQASSGVVWDTILNYSRYPQWVDNVTSCTIYRKNGKNWYTALISEVMFVEFGVYTHNRVRKEEGYMFWTLDYSRRSDADDLLGYWRVEQIQSVPPITRVDHSTELLLTGIPEFIVEYLSEDALINGTKWVKRESEKATR